MRRVSVPPVDLGLAVLLAGAAAASFALGGEWVEWGAGSRPMQVAGALGTCLAVALRRRAPLACVGTWAVATLAVCAFAEPPQILPAGIATMVVAFSAAAELEGRRLLAAAAVLLAVTLVRDVDDPLMQGGDVAIDVLLYSIAFAAGRVVAHRQRRVEHVARRAAVRTEEAVRDERARIARELHDVIAHGMSVMVVQADSARHGVAPEDGETRAALQSIERTGRESLREMRRLLGLLRDADPDGTSLAPQPGLAELPALVESVRRAGLLVDLCVEGEPTPLPPGTDLAAYRIVQEALTNALRHAGPARASVRVTFDRREVALEIADTGNGRVGDGGGGGNGLIGMRERARLYGGTLEVESKAGGFLVRANLPLDRQP